MMTMTQQTIRLGSLKVPLIFSFSAFILDPMYEIKERSFNMVIQRGYSLETIKDNKLQDTQT